MNAINRGLVSVRADAGGGDTRALVNQIQSAFEEFKKANDERLNGKADAVLNEKVDRINAHISDLQTQLADVASRNAGATLGGNASPVGEVQAAADFSRQTGQQVSPEDLRAYRAAINTYLRRGPATPADVQAAMSVGSDPDGGYLVEPTLGGRIVQKVYETSPIRQVANVTTIGTDALEGFNDLDEAGSGWVGEMDARNETSTPTLGQYRIPVYEVYAEPKATQKLLDDAAWNVEAWLTDKVSSRFVRQENTAFVNGDGSNKPRGFLDYTTNDKDDSARSWGKLQHVLTGANGEFLDLDVDTGDYPGDCLVDVVFALKAAYRSNAVWMMPRSVVATVRKLKDADGNYLWQPDFQQRQGGMLLGYPIVEAEDMPEADNGSLSIAFGDFNAGYQIVDRTGIRVLRDPYTQKGFVKFYATKRVGGDVVNFEAIKLLKFASA
ncbi:phage major capsid protein [Aquibaculum sediminis]|uniref:phage major capsid protein n=1 Tax=Aquibaculum sediminis TaxID=3231907 RepID=UPI0034527049